MKDLKEMKGKTEGKAYSTPSVRLIPLRMEHAICDSVVPGGNEDIGYEDWD